MPQYTVSECIWTTAQNLRVFKHLLHLNSVRSSGLWYKERYITVRKRKIHQRAVKYGESCVSDREKQGR